MISGGGKVILQQAEELARRGHTVTVVGPDPPPEPEWFVLRQAAYESCEFAASRALPAADIVVATFYTTIAPAVEFSRGKIFHLVQGVESELEFYRDQRAAIEAAYRLAPRKLAVAPHLKSFLQRAGYPDVVDVGQTFNAEDFRAGERRFNRRPPRLLLVGIYEGDVKGISWALPQLARLRREGVDFCLVRLSPEPPGLPERRLGVVDEYHQAIPPDSVARLLASVDLFLGANLPAEGFDLPALEALASGLPAVLSDIPAHRHSAGDAALFFPCGDGDEFLGAIRRLLDDELLYRELSERGPRRAAGFRTGDVGERLEAVFLDAAGRA